MFTKIEKILIFRVLKVITQYLMSRVIRGPIHMECMSIESELIKQINVLSEPPKPKMVYEDIVEDESKEVNSDGSGE